jgi:CHAT domain-containing protein
MTSSLIATPPAPGEAELTMNCDSYAGYLVQHPDQRPSGAASWSQAFAACVVEHLKAEADRHWYIDPNISLKLAEMIIAIGQERADLSAAALGTMAKGDALKFIGRTVEAWEALDLAGRMFREAGDEVGWARTRIGRLYLSTMLNRVEEALADAERAREIFEQRGEHEKLLRLYFQIAYVHNYRGRQSQALELYAAALEMAEALGAAGQSYLGPLYTNMGIALEAQGDFRQALAHYERARALFVSRGETLNVANAEANIAYISQAQGRYRRALRLLHGAVEQAAAQSGLEAAKIKWHLLDCYLCLNRYEEARDLARQVISDYRQFSDAFELARALVQLATAEAELGNFDAAQSALDEAEVIFTSLEATSWAATTWLKRGRLALKLGQAVLAFEEAGRAAASFDSSGQQVNRATAALLKGQAAWATGDLASAEIAGKTALRVAQRDNIPALRYTSHLLLGQVAETQRHRERAIRHYRAAAATTERVQRGLTITLRPGFLEDKGEAPRRLITLFLRAHQTQQAFETLEQSKSQVLLGYLANQERLRWAQDDAHSQALIEELDQLRAEHQWFYRLAHELPPDPGRPNPVSQSQALMEVAVRERRMRAITEQLYFHNRIGQGVNPAPTVSLGQIQQALAGETLLVEFYNDGVQLWAFTLDRQALAAHRLPATTENLSRWLPQLQMNIEAALNAGAHGLTARRLTLHAKRLLQRLYEALLAPLALERGRWQRLVIVPYGALHYLPFHLLFDGSSYLIEHYEVLVLPSAGLATRPGPRRPAGARCLAHSWEGQLPYTQAEAQTVQQLFGGTLHAEEAANRAALQAAPTQILHIAAHGRHRPDQPDLSYLQLADGQVYTDDLLQLDLSYELVTLSACETGRAQVAGGDERIGLGRGFLYAGAGALNLSLWPIADDTALHQMEQFYSSLLAGDSKPAALRQAQKTLLAQEAELHPAFWGAFQLVGDASPLSR